jgi:hypothetical protein
MSDESEEVTEEVEDSGPVSRRKKGSSKSGWCILRERDSHERCPVSVGSFTCDCTCENHGSRAGEPPAWTLEVLDIGDE